MVRPREPLLPSAFCPLPSESSKNTIDSRAHFHLKWWSPAQEDPRRLHAEERDGAVVYGEGAALAQADDRRLILLVKLQEALFARLAHMRRIRIGIEEVTVELEGDESEGVERERLNDGHVVRRTDGRRGDDAAGAGAGVRQSGADAVPQRLEQLALLQRLEQPEGVASADEHPLGVVELLV